MDQHAESARNGQLQHALGTILGLARLSRITIAYAPNEAAGAALHAVAKALADEELLVLVNSWNPDPLDSFRQAVLDSGTPAIADQSPALPVDRGHALVDLMRSLQARFQMPFTIIFDRFGEHLASDKNDQRVWAFDEAFIQIANDPSLDAHFLIVVDEQSASKVQERFGGRVEDLDDCYVRLPAEDPGTALPLHPGNASAAGDVFVDSPTYQPGEHHQLPEAAALIPGMPDDIPAPEAAHASASLPPAHDAGLPDSVSTVQTRDRSFGELIGRLEGVAGEKDQEPAAQDSHAEGLRPESRIAADKPVHVQNDVQNDDRFSGFGSDELPAPIPGRSRLRVDAKATGSAQADVAPPPVKAGTPNSFATSPALEKPKAPPPQPPRNRLLKPRMAAAGLAVAALLLMLSIAVVQTGKTPAREENVAVPGKPQAESDASPSLSGASVNAATDAGTGQSDVVVDSDSSTTAVEPDEPGQPASAAIPARNASGTQASLSSPSSVPAVSQRQGPPGVYIHVLNEEAREQARLLSPLLLKKGIAVVGIKVVSAGPKSSDLRYFHQSEKEEAMRVHSTLLSLGLPVQRLKRITGFEATATPRQYELWLVADYKGAVAGSVARSP
jgi:hypothetical protein